MRGRRFAATAGITAVALAGIGTGVAQASGTSQPGPGTISAITSTVPGNGDVNPYGVAVVPRSIGHLVRGHVLVSNFNNSGNFQGTGTTIVQVSPGGQLTQFAQISGPLPGSCPGGVGLTTALVVLNSGWVIVGSLPTSDGTSATMQAGCLIVLDNTGAVRETIAGDGINGPWDMTAQDLGTSAHLFVTSVLNGTVRAGGDTVDGGTVLRIDITSSEVTPPQVQGVTQIASGLAERTDQAALVVGPTGVGLGGNDTLYIADSVNSRIAAIPDAVSRTTSDGAGQTVTQGGALKDPLGLSIGSGGNIFTANGGDGNLVGTTTSGTQASVTTVDTNNGGGGNLFGLVANPTGRGIYFVDDFSNTLMLLH